MLRYGKEEIYCITFDVLKVLIIAPIKSCNDIVEATFYGSCQLPAMQESEIIVTGKYHAPNHTVKLKYAMSTICINGYVKYKLSPVSSDVFALREQNLA